MPAMQKMSPEISHLTNENEKHKMVVEQVYDKWLGEGYAERCGEGLAAQSAIRACSKMNAEAQSVAPVGKPIGMTQKALSNRSKGGESAGSNKRMLSSRK